MKMGTTSSLSPSWFYQIFMSRSFDSFNGCVASCLTTKPPISYKPAVHTHVVLCHCNLEKVMGKMAEGASN